MAVAELLTEFKTERTARAKIDKARKDFLAARDRDPDTGGVVLATAADKAEWAKIRESLEIADHSVDTARADVNAERYEAEVEAEMAELDRMRAKAGKDDLPRGEDAPAAVSLGSAMKQITMATGAKSKEGEIKLPALSLHGGNPAYTQWEADDADADASGVTAPDRIGMSARYCQVDAPAQLTLDRVLAPAAPAQRLTLDVDKTAIGDAFPTMVAPAVMRKFDEARLPMYCTIYTTPTGNTLKVRRRNSLSGASTTDIPWGQPPPHVAEGVGINNLEPTYDVTDLMAWSVKYTGTLTYEVMRDLMPEDIQAEVTNDMIGAMVLYMAWLAVKGSASSQGEGVATRFDTDQPGAATAVVGTADSHVPTVNELAKMLHGIAERYASNAKFATSWANIGDLRTLVGTDGHPILQDDFSGEWPGRIHGVPVFATPGFSDFGDDVKAPLILADWSCMGFRYVEGMALDRSDDVNFKEDETVWRIRQTYDCKPLDVNGFRAFNSKDTS